MTPLGRALLRMTTALACSASLGAAPRPTTPLNLLTLNCYCFNEKQADFLLQVSTARNYLYKIAQQEHDAPTIDLHKGIQRRVPDRLRAIAEQVLAAHPEVAFFQEVWTLPNKQLLGGYLTRNHAYRYFYGGHAMNISGQVDDGLAIASKWPPFFTGYLEYREKRGAETRAHKGAALMGVYIPGGGFLLLVNTHLQAGNDNEDCLCREDQITQLVAHIQALGKLDWRIQNASVLFGGDLNEPITLLNGILFDRSRYLVKWFNHQGLGIDNDQALAQLCRATQAREVVQYDQTLNRGVTLIPEAGRPASQWTVRQAFQSAPQWPKWDPLPQATDLPSQQVLDHLFMDSKVVTLESFEVLRKAILGDPGRSKVTSDPNYALSDHAAVLYHLRLRPYL